MAQLLLKSTQANESQNKRSVCFVLHKNEEAKERGKKKIDKN